MSYTPQTLLSINSKCGCSLDLPIIGHCRPTPNCKHDCYARTGRQSLPEARKKHLFVSKYLKGKNLTILIHECKSHTSVRLNGSGDLLPTHIPSLIHLAEACPHTQFWGMTRKTEIATATNGKCPNLKLLVTVDASSPASTWKYQGKMCYGPKRPGDIVPNLKRIITIFPRHHGGKVVKGVTKHPKDCLAVWHKISGCVDCERCWSW